MRSFASALTAISLGLLSCSSPPGDQPTDAGPPSPLGSGYRIHQLTPPKGGDATDNMPPNPLHPTQNASVYVTGVTHIWTDSFDETHDGKSLGSVYVQDVGSTAPFSGIELYAPTYQPSSLHVAPGDVIDLTGLYQDIASLGLAVFTAGQVLPEIAKPIAKFRFEYQLPDPVVVDPADLSVIDQAHYDKGRQWMGMLVKLNNVAITGPVTDDGKGRVSGPITMDTTANGVSVDNELYDLKTTDFPVGTQFKSITGIVTYFFSFHISPRTPDDIKMP